MNRGVDEVIVRVDNKSDAISTAQQLPPPFPNSATTTTHRIAHNRVPSNSNGTRSESMERSLGEETNDAIWEEFASPDTSGSAIAPPRQDLRQRVNGNSSNSNRRTASHLSLEKMPRQESNPGRPPKDHRHHSLDLDVHISEPNLVLLQDGSCRPLSDHLHETDFSFRPKLEGDMGGTIAAAPQQLQQLSSSSNLQPAFPLPAHPDMQVSSSSQQPQLNSQHLGSGRRAAVEAITAVSSANSGGDGLRVKLLETPTESRKIGLRSDEAGEDTPRPIGKPPVVDASPMSTIKQQQSIQMRSAPSLVSRELVKMKTKSRLVEPAEMPSVESAEKKGAQIGQQQSPARPSTHVPNRVEDPGDEDDPFKDIDLQDRFRKGNLKPITVMQWLALVVIMAALVCSLTVKVLKGRQLWGLDLWKWFLMVLVIFCGRLVSGWIIHILVIIFERNFILRKKVLYFVYGLRKGVQNCLWLGLVLLAWKLMFDPHMEQSTNNNKVLKVVTKLLECLVLGAFIWLAKLLLVKSLASSFHVSAFFDRIQESLFNQHVLETLSGPPLHDLGYESFYRPSMLRNSIVHVNLGKPCGGKESTPISVEDLQKMSTKNVSAGLMKRLMNVVQSPGIRNLFTTIDETVSGGEAYEDIEINSEMQAKAAAKMIFKNVARPDSRVIEREDLLRFVDPEEVTNVMCLFEGAKDMNKITKKALRNWVVKVYQERKALAHSLNDTKTAVKELHKMISVLVAIIIIIVWLLILGIATTKVLVFATSQMLLVGFMFGNTLKTVFEAIIFLFVMHPYDVGDRCIVDGVQLVVEEMKILTTVFLKPDNEKVFYPNAVLATKPISNLYRSPDMKELLSFSIHISTPTEKINAFKDRIAAYVEKRSEQWNPKFSITINELEDLNRLRLSVSMQHTMNFQNMGERLSRRSELLLDMKKSFEELKIEYHPLLQTVNIAYGIPQTMGVAAPMPPMMSSTYYTPSDNVYKTL